MTSIRERSETIGSMSRDMPDQPSPLDDTDRRIVHLLQKDGRMSMRDLAAAVHVSRAHVYTRVKRLLDEGVIRRFTIQVDPELVGFSTSAYITMKVEQNSWRQVRDTLAALPWVEHVALVSGDFDVLLLVRSASNKPLRDLVFSHI